MFQQESDILEDEDGAIGDLRRALEAIRADHQYGTCNELCSTAGFKMVETALQHANSHTCSGSPMASLWLSYLQMVSHLLQFVRASRRADWRLHLQSFRQMLPWFFAYDHPNYARYGAYYWVTMQQLPNTHPSAHAALLAGDFSVARSASTFARVPVDQTIEQTLNRDSKTKGGVIGKIC